MGADLELTGYLRTLCRVLVICAFYLLAEVKSLDLVQSLMDTVSRVLRSKFLTELIVFRWPADLVLQVRTCLVRFRSTIAIERLILILL